MNDKTCTDAGEMGVRDDQEYARKSMAAVGWILAILASWMLIITLFDMDWARFESDDGSGEFGLYKYRFTINGTHRAGRINTDSNTSLCNLQRYNAARQKSCNDDSPCRDDCDDMIDACGIARVLTITSVVGGFGAGGFGIVSMCTQDKKDTKPAVRWARKWPRYATVACGFAAVAATAAYFSAWSYAATLPASPDHFLQDYDTPGTHRQWVKGRNYLINIGGGLAFTAAAVALYLARQSKRLFTGMSDTQGNSSASLLSNAHEPQGFDQGTVQGTKQDFYMELT